jgi:iron complex outermembrane receptor protein
MPIQIRPIQIRGRRLPLLASAAFAFALPFQAQAADAADAGDSVLVAPLTVAAPDAPVQETRPTTVETLTADQIETTTSVINTEDALRYLPSVLIRKRHIGDTQAPMATRTSGVGSSARGLIYADGVLLSALIGNNNASGSPKWGMVSPQEIERISVLYGPFSAAYPGNSIGAVVEIETRMPTGLEGSIDLSGSRQSFSQYATDGDFDARQVSATVGDRVGRLSWWLGGEWTDSDSQPLAFVTATRPAAPSAAGTPLTGAFATRNRLGSPIVVLGAGGFESQTQDNLKLKLAWDFDGGVTLTYAAGRFGNDTDATAQSYLRNAAGQTIYAGGPFNIGGYAYPSIAAGAFANNVYRLDETQWMQGLSLSRRSKDGRFDWRIVASSFDFGQSEQRTPSTALPGAMAGGAGSVTRFDGTGWKTLDAKVIWRPGETQEFSFGAHGDRYELNNERYATADWRAGPVGLLASAARGRTQTAAVWAQDVWRASPDVEVTLGGRWESWRATEGFNFNRTPTLSVRQPSLSDETFSPKASVAWDFADGWSARLSVGRAYRFPTVTELYQAISTGAVLTVPNPDLRPEAAWSSELALSRTTATGSVRLSLFTEDIDDALISQTAPLVVGSPTLFSFVQNIDHVRSRGAELVFRQDDLLIDGLSLSGSVTWVDPKITRDNAFQAAEGKQLPQVPNWRATLVATWRPGERWAFTLAGRYSDRTYATLDNSDPVTHTYQGFDRFLVFDARASLKLNPSWTAALGIENLGAQDYFLFHPFPQRTVIAQLGYRF